MSENLNENATRPPYGDWHYVTNKFRRVRAVRVERTASYWRLFLGRHYFTWIYKKDRAERW